MLRFEMLGSVVGKLNSAISSSRTTGSCRICLNTAKRRLKAIKKKCRKRCRVTGSRRKVSSIKSKDALAALSDIWFSETSICGAENPKIVDGIPFHEN